MTTVVGCGFASAAEGFMARCNGGITGTAIDLALDAAALYGEGGVGAAYAAAKSSTISYLQDFWTSCQSSIQLYASRKSYPSCGRNC